MAHDRHVVGWVWAFMYVPFEVCHMPPCYGWVLMCVPLKLIVQSRDHSDCFGIRRGYHLYFYQSESRCHASGQILSLTTSHIGFPASPGFLVLVDNDLTAGTTFDKTGCLQWVSSLVASHLMCRTWFSWDSYRFLSHSSTFVD